MEARTILAKVRDSGLQIALRDNKITLNPISRLSDDLRQLISGNRESVTLAIKNAPGRLVNLAIHAGVHEQGYQFSPSEIRRVTDDKEMQDVVNCSRLEMQAWASALAIRATQRRAKVPPDWNKTSDCRQCGLVYSDHGVDTLSCGWCWMRHAGLPFPQPEGAK
jgi:hypothetical protein